VSEQANLINVYRCDVCGKATVTKNRDEGTTPFMISCRATPRCKGSMQSACYRVDQTLTPDLMWIKPTPQELANFLRKQSPRFHRAIREHVDLGGLIEVPAKELVH
jgi:ssDNA-binding Zn-finger/Zn-ribbon topoisomerase 1